MRSVDFGDVKFWEWILDFIEEAKLAISHFEIRVDIFNLPHNNLLVVWVGLTHWRKGALVNANLKIRFY